MKANKSGGLPLSRSESEVKQPMAPCAAGKYVTGSNVADQDKARAGLASFAKANKAKY